MNHETEILNRLAKGETPETITKSFNEALLKAMELQKADEARRANDARLNELATNIANDLCEYLKLAKPELAPILNYAFPTGEDLRQILDIAVNELNAGMPMPIEKKAAPAPTKKSSDQILNDFLREMGL